MKTLRELKRAAAAALEYLRAQPQVKEAEVFVASNANLCTRLNYTSHIPCNGVEEPKSLESFGLGIRALFDTPEGVKVGFGSQPSDLSLQGVERALEKARRNAVRDPEFLSLPRPSPERRTLVRYHDPRLMAIGDGELVSLGWRVVEGALDTFFASEELVAAAGGREEVKNLGLILGGDVTLLQERMALASTHFPEVQTDESTILMSFVTAMVETQNAKGSGWWAGPRLEEFSGEAGAEAARKAIRGMGGQRIKDGEYNVVFGPQAVTDLVHNLILPALQLDLFYAAASPFLGKLGKPVAWEKLTLYDHGALPGLAGSKGITCEGLPTGRTDLIRNGVLVGLLANYYESQRILHDPRAREKLGVDPREWSQALVPRNGFRFSRGGGRHFDTPPGIAGTNVILEAAEKLSTEELLRLVGDGLYIGRIWYTYPINGISSGDFTSTAVGDSYIVKNGRLFAPLKPNTVRINDNIHRLLNNILGMGTEARGTLVWAADQIVYAPEMAVKGVPVKEIAGYIEGL